MNTPDTNPLDVLTNPDREAEKRELYERALEKTRAEQESKTTSDTEWREVQGKVGYTLNIGEHHTYIENRLTPDEMRGIKNLIEYSLSSRDTYWKERVLAIIEKHDPSTNRETSPVYWGNTLREEIKSLR